MWEREIFEGIGENIWLRCLPTRVMRLLKLRLKRRKLDFKAPKTTLEVMRFVRRWLINIPHSNSDSLQDTLRVT